MAAAGPSHAAAVRRHARRFGAVDPRRPDAGSEVGYNGVLQPGLQAPAPARIGQPVGAFLLPRGRRARLKVEEGIPCT
jgi:hypothetical protein